MASAEATWPVSVYGHQPFFTVIVAIIVTLLTLENFKFCRTLALSLLAVSQLFHKGKIRYPETIDAIFPEIKCGPQ